MRYGHIKYRGFTLIEVTVSSMIAAFIAMIAVGTLNAVTDAKKRVQLNTASADELRYAVNLVRDDFENIYRGNRNLPKVIGYTDPQSGFQSLTVRTVSNVKARSGYPEGDVYEVQYTMLEREGKTVLVRRKCPIVGLDPEMAEYTEGGILSTIIEDVTAFNIRYFDQQQWYSEWSNELTELPALIEVTLAVNSSGDAENPKPLMRTFICSSFRNSQIVQAEDTETEETSDSGDMLNESAADSQEVMQ